LSKGDSVALVGFGTYSVKERAERKGRIRNLEKKLLLKLQKFHHLRLVNL